MAWRHSVLLDEACNLFISDIIYAPDYVLRDYLGNPVNYRINEVDLP